MPAFDIGRFVESCFQALETERPVERIRELLNVTVSKPVTLIEGLPDPLGQELVLFSNPRSSSSMRNSGLASPDTVLTVINGGFGRPRQKRMAA